MRRLTCGALAAALVGLAAGGCKQKEFDGPTVKAFTGRVVKDGKPVALPADEAVELKVILQEKAQSFGVPLQPDGSFTIGWMPIGKYSAILVRRRKDSKGGPNMYNVPNGFEIKDGQTEYEIDLGKNWKP